jgi:hypothetical protein
MEMFADAAARAQWAQEKDMRVFSIHSPAHPLTEVDLFIEVPFDFERAHLAALRAEVADGVVATFVGLDDLIEMKRVAGRPKDLADSHQLERIRERLANE